MKAAKLGMFDKICVDARSQTRARDDGEVFHSRPRGLGFARAFGDDFVSRRRAGLAKSGDCRSARLDDREQGPQGNTLRRKWRDRRWPGDLAELVGAYEHRRPRGEEAGRTAMRTRPSRAVAQIRAFAWSNRIGVVRLSQSPWSCAMAAAYERDRTREARLCEALVRTRRQRRRRSRLRARAARLSAARASARR